MKALWLLALVSVPLWASGVETLKSSTSLHKSPSEKSQSFGKLKEGSQLLVLEESSDWVKAQVKLKDGREIVGYVPRAVLAPKAVLKKEPELETAEEPEEESEERYEPKLSISGSLSGYSSSTETQLTIGVEARYAWVPWTESIVGLDFLIATGGPYVGGHFGERFYVPTYPLRPYVEAAFAMDKFSDSTTSAIEVGGGVQYNGDGNFFAEFGAVYVFRTPFSSTAENRVAFRGGSGFRF